MARENFRKTKYKIPRFGETFDDALDWQDKIEIQDLGRKTKKTQRKRRDGLEKW